MNDALPMKSNLILYQTEDGNTRIEVRLEDETIWLSQAQMAELFDKDVRTINEHLKTIFKEDELRETSTIRKFRIVRKEGNRFLHRNNSLHNRHNEPIINDTGLAALTLLVAESNPQQKESLIRLIIQMLKQPDRLAIYTGV